jgi:glutaconyl-CoA/methylmalonyl-CoA decarboxylase subunit gamma
MIYKVKIEGQIFSVEIQDLRTRPVVAVVNGIPVEVWPEAESTAARPARPSGITVNDSRPLQPIPQPVKPKVPQALSTNCELQAPIPGVIISIAVQTGDEVDPGQELLQIEAMKMKNIIRSSRQGVIEKIHIHPGQTVRHQEVLLTYAD